MMLMVLRLYWKPVGQVRAPRPPVPIFLTWTSATHFNAPASGVRV
jgi:hypothetical protein